jgi:hypothetical protein
MLRRLLQEVVLHSWDVAKATGQRVTYSTEAADAVLRLLEEGSDPMRRHDWYARARARARHRRRTGTRGRTIRA